MATPKTYLSTDSGAPTLNGTAGSLIDVLHACLVGSSGIAYAGKPAAGWSEPFTITSTKAVFRNSIASGGSGCYVRVLDDGSTTGPPAGAANIEAYLRTYASMTDMDTGTDACNQVLVRKSGTASSAARAWAVVADELRFYVVCGATNAAFITIDKQDGVYFAGDIDSLVPGDAYSFGCSGRGVSSANAAGGILVSNYTSFTAALGSYFSLSRSYTGVSGAAMASLMYPWTSRIGGIGSPFDNPSVGNAKQLWLPAMVCEGGIIRGRLPGCFVSMNKLYLQNNGGVYTALDGFPAGSAIMIAGGGAENGSSNTGAIGIETSCGW